MIQLLTFTMARLFLLLFFTRLQFSLLKTAEPTLTLTWLDRNRNTYRIIPRIRRSTDLLFQFWNK